jgi:hypothetical protein
VVVVMIFRMWDLNFGTWISHSGLHMIQEARDFTVSKGHGHPLMCLKLKEIFEILSTLTNLMDDDSMVVFELALLISNIKKEACNIFEFIFSCLRKYEEKSYNILSLMLDLRFNILCLVCSFTDSKQGVIIFEEYDKKFLYLCL